LFLFGVVLPLLSKDLKQVVQTLQWQLRFSESVLFKLEFSATSVFSFAIKVP
jgi:hypothetical protein